MSGVTSPPGVEVSSLESFLRAECPGLLTGPLRAGLLSGGRSNLTYLLTDGHERWVLRRPPLGHVLATAHDMGREFRVLGALHPTDVPVPRPIVSAGPDVLGAPFYVMEFADGDVLRERAQLEAAAAPALAGELVDVLARLHRLDPAAVGLADLGRPAGYLERQVRRWGTQLAASGSREVPGIAELGTRLGQRLPAHQRAGIVHGDYRLDNVVTGRDDGRVLGVLDWEMATLGDPLTDVASMVVWWDGIRGLDSPVAAVPGDVPGFPSGDTLVEHYARATGWDLAGFAWYLAFAYYKIAVIFEGIHYRAEQGLTVGEGFDRLGALVPALVERGHDALGTGLSG
ncbi:phosphotransferase family protein [Prauserella cavernicola]|uniref:Phosphotransferase family protein n=1 Tax=Prauserella cavernicola TaxID=2800127 RepID=A0A934QWC0_9PSEU|nr:phosphotransferase family protein [Prauserella cavernicola]MBK1787623.1 phosphotransferase family protein [Prauserella cavernicola]